MSYAKDSHIPSKKINKIYQAIRIFNIFFRFIHVIFSFLKVHFRAISPPISNPDKWMFFCAHFESRIWRTNTNLYFFFSSTISFKMSSEVTVSFIDRKKTSHDIIALNFDCLTIYDNLHYNGELIYSTPLKLYTLLYCICLVLTFFS